MTRVLAVLIAALALLVARPACAAETVVVRPTDLRADRYVDAPALRPLNAGTKVELLAIEAGWVQVQVDGTTGWLRATGLTGDAASVAALARLEGGRGAPGNIVVAAGIRSVPKASKHALIVGVERVATGTSATRRWPGVAYDVEAARLVAQRFGVPPDNVDVVDGSGATTDGIAAAVARLAGRVQPGDDVLVWFSGPGTQSADGGACVAAWAAAEGRALTADALVELLAPVLRAARKTVVIADASYQVASAALGSTRKVIVSAGGCRAAQDALALVPAAVARGFDPQNLVVLQSAAGAAQGLDAPRGGGILSQALLDCFLGDAEDADRSGSLSIDEVVACTNRRPSGPLAVVTGNGRYAPLVGLAPAAAEESSAPSTPPAQAARAALDDVYAQRDGRIHVTLAATPSTLQIGRDDLDLTVTSARAGYVYLVLLGSDGASYSLLFPNEIDRDNRIAAGASLRLPRPAWRVQAQGPAGRDTLLAVVAESPRDLAPFTSKEGPFATALTDAGGKVQLQWLLGRSGKADSAACVDGGKRRNLAAVPACSDAFGAAIVDVIER